MQQSCFIRWELSGEISDKISANLRNLRENNSKSPADHADFRRSKNIYMIKNLIILIFLFAESIAAQPKTTFKFSLDQKEVPGYVKVDPSVKYSDENGYGFDFGTVPEAIDRVEEKYSPADLSQAINFHFFSLKYLKGTII